jgi:polyisoprenoid-binding protein YceI
MTRTLLRLAPLLFALVPFCAGAKAWTVDAAKSTLGFSGTYQGEKFSGKFGKFDAAIAYDPADLGQAKFDVSIDVTSAATGNADYDGQLKTAEFFDFAKFPKAHFVASSFRKDGDAVIADGTLTIRDKSKPVSLAVKFAEAGGGATLDVSTTLKRLDFDVGSGDWSDTGTIANEVPVSAHLVLTPKAGG